MRLTDRDLQMLLKVNECQWLSTSQIKRYFFGATTNYAVNKRLKLLVDSDYLVCERLSFTDEYFFRVGSQGKEILIERACLEPEHIHVPHRLPAQLNHFAKINNLRWYCEKSIEKENGVLKFFFVDRELKGLLGNSLIVPDALVGFTLSKRSKAGISVLALEYDAGTENPQYFGRDKVKKYYKEAENGHHLFTHRSFRVVVFADTRKRIIQLVRHSIRFLNNRISFLFGSIEDLEKKNDLFAPIFVDPQRDITNEEIVCSLIE